ncbi:NADH-quinone oxidoreductase subunit C [Desulfovulcanus sp.]
MKNFCISLDKLIPAVKELDNLGYFLEDVSCVHVKEGFELVYHFDHWDNPGRITLRTIISDDQQAETISHIFPGADWHERECYDFFGVHFKGHKNLIPLLLAPDLGEHPLLKSSKEQKELCHILPDCEYVLTAPQDEEFDKWLKSR